MSQINIQELSLALALLGSIFAVYLLLKNKAHWDYIVPILVYMVHTSLYYFTILWFIIRETSLSEYTGLPSAAGNWSSILRLHGVITSIAMLVITSQHARRN